MQNLVPPQLFEYIELPAFNLYNHYSTERKPFLKFRDIVLNQFIPAFSRPV